jgi:hypothetical protein
MNSEFLEQPIFICGHRKTGTTLLINLLDGIKGALTYPDDSGFFYMYFPKWASKEVSLQEKLTRIGDRIIGHNLKEVIERTECSDQEKAELHDHRETFKTLFLAYEGDCEKTPTLLRHFIESFRQAFFINAEASCWIEKTTSTELYAMEIKEWFPKAKFIHIVRDPRDNWASLKSGWEKRYQDFNDDQNRLMHSLLERGKLGMEYASLNREHLGEESYKVVRYEDLVSEPKKLMEEIAEFIGLPFSQKFLYPTTFGHQWSGNNFNGVKANQPFTTTLNRWASRISEEEAQLVEYYFKGIMGEWGYEPSFSAREQQAAATEHYKWYNFSTQHSVS